MAARTRFLQIAIAGVNLLIFTLAFTSLWPFASGDFKVDLPSATEVEWTYDEGFVTVTAPYSIVNGGFYDVSDLVVRYAVTNVDNRPIASDVFDIGTIQSGTTREDTLVFTMDLQQLYDEGLADMIFDYDYLNFLLEVTCKYTMKLIDFSAEYTVGVPWDPLIQDPTVDEVAFDSGTGELTVEYHITTSDLLSGTATITATLYEGSLALSADTSTVRLGETYSGTFVFTVPPGSVPDSIVFEADVDGFALETSYELPAGVVP